MDSWDWEELRIHSSLLPGQRRYVCVQWNLVSVDVPDPKPTPARIAFSIVRVILEATYAPDEVWGRD